MRLQILDGMVRAASAEDDLARSAFIRALQKDPGVQLPPAAAASSRAVRRLFDQARREVEARATNKPVLASQVSKLAVEGKLEGAEALVAEASTRKDLSKVESGQVFALKGLLLVLKGLQTAGPVDAERVKAAQNATKQLAAVEQQLASTSKESLSESESAQQLVLKGMALMVKGLVKAETGDAAQAKAAFAEMLKLDPTAQVAPVAAPRAQKVFEEAKAEAPPPPPTSQGLPGQISTLYADGKLEQAEVLLTRSAERDLSKTEKGHVLVMKGLLLVLKGLQKADDRAKAAAGAEGEMKALETQLAATGKGTLSEAESAQHLMLKGLVFMVKGLVKAESGNEAQAKAAFAQALELDPNAKVPSMGTNKVQKLFDEQKAVTAAATPQARGLPEDLTRLYADGKLERAELLLAESSAPEGHGQGGDRAGVRAQGAAASAQGPGAGGAAGSGAGQDRGQRRGRIQGPRGAPGHRRAAERDRHLPAPPAGGPHPGGQGAAEGRGGRRGPGAGGVQPRGGGGPRGEDPRGGLAEGEADLRVGAGEPGQPVRRAASRRCCPSSSRGIR